ncbi:pseudouridine synthase deg1 [Exophiala xenobiotica]|nr:pseudouridine synthase deg1 [Exophiala xenobiotica]
MPSDHPSTTTTGLESAPSTTSTDYTSYTNADLISRISRLESQLRDQTARLAALTTSTSSSQQPATSQQRSPPLGLRTPSPSPSGRSRPFDPSLYSTRHIALKFAYLGGRYNGFEHANGNINPKPTIEEVLWKALRKARLISPTLSAGADDKMEVLWSAHARMRRYTRGDTPEDYENGAKVRLDLNWEGCQYSKCGRTDKGVSAFGQVVGVRVRSNKPIAAPAIPLNAASYTEEKDVVEHDGDGGRKSGEGRLNDGGGEGEGEGDREGEGELPAIDAEDLETESYAKPFDPVKDELAYVSILNALLPPDIRVLAWCPNPPPTFDARFSCRERRYKYFFTNPAFCPTPGEPGLKKDSRGGTMREGWLDIDKMRQAAKKLEGHHDFRNLCKIDASKQMPSCERRITFADVVEFEGAGRVFDGDALSQHGSNSKSLADSLLGSGSKTVANGDPGPKVYTFCVHGTAFLWHQVRCMVAMLFLVGQGLEEPSLIDELLDVEKNPGRPMYEMADDAPLVLWDCVFPDDDKDMVDSLNWLYAGDEATLTAMSTKNDGKFGAGAVVDELWSLWREAKMKEILAGSLLDLAIGQGDGSALQRGSRRSPNGPPGRSQKVFQGADNARLGGRYIPVMQKPKMDPLHLLNAKWANGRQARRDPAASKSLEDGGDD